MISQIKQVGGRVFDRILSDKNIDAFNGAQGRILYILWQGDGVPISKLSKETGLAMNTLTSMLDRMEAAGLVRRDRGDHDRRKILIYLTAEIESIYYKGFSSEEIDALEGYLRRVLTNVEEAL